MKLQAYADCDEVEFLVNGKSYGKVAPVEYKAFCEVPFEAGIVEVRAIRGGEVVAADRIETAGAPAAIVLTAERAAVAADGMDLAFIHVDLVDAEGKPSIDVPVMLTAKVSGAGKFLAIGSGNPCTQENFTDSRLTFHGSALVCARALRDAGEMLIEVSGDGVKSASITIAVK